MQADLQDKKIFELVDNADRILLLTDERIDGDTTGSTLAVFHWLSSLGKTVRVFSPKPWPEAYQFLPGSKEVCFEPTIFSEPWDLIIIFDCSDGLYVKPLLPLLPRQAPLAVFDHHATNPLYGTVNQVQVEASSTGEVVWRFMKGHRIEITKDIATCLLTAICTDTTLFTNPGTNEACMQAAAELGLAGARVQDVVRAVYMNKSVAMLRLWGLALERLVELPDGTVVTFLKEEDVLLTQAEEVDASAISNFLNGMLAGASIVCVFSERPDGSVKASLRSLTRDVGAIAQRYGGGGHTLASGFSLPGTRLVETEHGWGVKKSDETTVSVAELLKS